MRRVTKKLLVLLTGVLFTALYCEFLIYYVVIAQCSWPVIENTQDSDSILKALILADTHLLGPRKGHWLDKWRRESQMHCAFQAIISVHRPDAVFVLGNGYSFTSGGPCACSVICDIRKKTCAFCKTKKTGDLFDEGQWSNEKQFQDYVERFYRLFSVPEDISMHIAVGNHDIGFHNYVRRGSVQRFAKAMNSSSSVQFLTLKDNHFVLINSMAMEGDFCNMCTEARRKINSISEKNKCSQYPNQCQNSRLTKDNYSRPILMQHFPLFRISDAVCTEPDAPPLPERNKRFRLKIDALSKEATEYLVSKIKPRVAFGGHTHHGCLLHHSYENNNDFYEYSVPSFSWRNRPDPKYMLVSITPDDYAVHKCGLPMETTVALTAVILLFIVIWYTITSKLIGRT